MSGMLLPPGQYDPAGQGGPVVLLDPAGQYEPLAAANPPPCDHAGVNAGMISSCLLWPVSNAVTSKQSCDQFPIV